MSVFFLLSPKRALVVSLLVMLLILYRHSIGLKRVMVVVREFVYRKTLMLFLTVIIIGIVLRVLFALWKPGVINQDIPLKGFDYALLWKQAGILADGGFVENKSWMTVLFYGLGRLIMGDSLYGAYVWTNLLWFGTCLLMFFTVRRTMGRAQGVLSFGFLFLSPTIIAHSGEIATEHCYSFFVVATFCVLSYALPLRGNFLRTSLYAGMLGCLSWLALWSRAEGILLWVAIPVLLTIDCIHVRGHGKQHMCFGLVFTVVFVFGASIAMAVNSRLSEDRTIFCSNDNYWPRLFGSSIESGGGINSKDIWLIWHNYLADHPDCDWTLDCDGYPLKMQGKCPAEVIPYMHKEILYRWSKMSFRELIKFVVKKENNDWSREPVIYGANGSEIHNCGALFYGATFLCAIIFFLRGRIGSTVAMFPILLVAGNMVILGITESSSRYGWLSLLLWGGYVAAGVCHGATQMEESEMARVRADGERLKKR